MSEESSVVTAQHFRYVAERTPGDDKFLTELKQAAKDAGIPTIWVAPEQASFMQILLKAAQAKEVVEVGTLAGYSAIVMARALPKGGRVKTIEIDEKHAAFAEEWFDKCTEGGVIELHRGPGAEVLATFPDNSADAMFLDADKASYPVYLEQACRIVKQGGLIMADNAFAFGELFAEQPEDNEVDAVRAFNDVMAKESRVHGVIVPIGDGLWVGVRK